MIDYFIELEQSGQDLEIDFPSASSGCSDWISAPHMSTLSDLAISHSDWPTMITGVSCRVASDRLSSRNSHYHPVGISAWVCRARMFLVVWIPCLPKTKSTMKIMKNINTYSINRQACHWSHPISSLTAHLPIMLMCFMCCCHELSDFMYYWNWLSHLGEVHHPISVHHHAGRPCYYWSIITLNFSSFQVSLVQSNCYLFVIPPAYYHLLSSGSSFLYSVILHFPSWTFRFSCFAFGIEASTYHCFDCLRDLMIVLDFVKSPIFQHLLWSIMVVVDLHLFLSSNQTYIAIHPCFYLSKASN